MQKQRASRSRDEAEQVRVELAERDAVISQLRAELETTRADCNRLARDKQHADDDTSALQVSVP